MACGFVVLASRAIFSPQTRLPFLFSLLYVHLQPVQYFRISQTLLFFVCIAFMWLSKHCWDLKVRLHILHSTAAPSTHVGPWKHLLHFWGHRCSPSCSYGTLHCLQYFWVWKAPSRDTITLSSEVEVWFQVLSTKLSTIYRLKLTYQVVIGGAVQEPM